MGSKNRLHWFADMVKWWAVGASRQNHVLGRGFRAGDFPTPKSRYTKRAAYSSAVEATEPKAVRLERGVSGQRVGDRSHNTATPRSYRAQKAKGTAYKACGLGRFATRASNRVSQDRAVGLTTSKSQRKALIYLTHHGLAFVRFSLRGSLPRKPSMQFLKHSIRPRV